MSLEAALNDPLIAGYDVWEVLLALPKKGRWAVGKALGAADVRSMKRVGQLTERQVTVLCESLDGG